MPYSCLILLISGHPPCAGQPAADKACSNCTDTISRCKLASWSCPGAQLCCCSLRGANLKLASMVGWGKGGGRVGGGREQLGVSSRGGYLDQGGATEVRCENGVKRVKLGGEV